MNEIYSIAIAVIPFYVLWRYKVALDARETLIEEVREVISNPKYSETTKDFVLSSFKDSTRAFLIFDFLFEIFKNAFTFKLMRSSRKRKLDKALAESGARQWEIEQVIDPFIQKILTINFLRAPLSYIVVFLLALLIIAVKFFLIAIAAAFAFNPSSVIAKGPTKIYSPKANIYTQVQMFWKASHLND